MKAYDDGDPVQSSNLNITIEVQDINDNPPTFSQAVYDLSLSESAPPLSQVGYVNATDRDSGQNAKVHYRIQEDQDIFGKHLCFKKISLFWCMYMNVFLMYESFSLLYAWADPLWYLAGVFPSTGKLYNEYSFSQQEVRESFTLHIIATDNGSPKLSATCTVNINIADENDNIPRFSQPVFELRVAENALIGKDIGSVTAADVDEGDNSRLTYALPDEVTAFRINANTGKLYVKSAIDREEDPRFEFSVSVADAGECCYVAEFLS